MASKVILVTGMAGSGKTWFIERASEFLRKKDKSVFIVNLDPAVVHTGYESNIDIRDVVDYQELQKKGLGCNGAITASLLIYMTVIDQVVDLLSKKTGYIFVDTPGQIEAMTNSSAGELLVEALQTHLDVSLVYVIDGSRCSDPQVALANRLYATSLFYRYKLPLTQWFNRQTYTTIPPFSDNSSHTHYLTLLKELLDEFPLENKVSTLNFLLEKKNASSSLKD